MSNTNSEHY